MYLFYFISFSLISSGTGNRQLLSVDRTPNFDEKMSMTNQSSSSRNDKVCSGRKHVIVDDRGSKFSFLPIEFWDRSEECREAKSEHLSRIDKFCSSREYLVLNTTLWKNDIVLEPNMFPCKLLLLHFTN
jgi:hypothetical protein